MFSKCETKQRWARITQEFESILRTPATDPCPLALGGFLHPAPSGIGIAYVQHLQNYKVKASGPAWQQHVRQLVAQLQLLSRYCFWNRRGKTPMVIGYLKPVSAPA